MSRKHTVPQGESAEVKAIDLGRREIFRGTMSALSFVFRIKWSSDLSNTEESVYKVDEPVNRRRGLSEQVVQRKKRRDGGPNPFLRQ